MKINWVDVIQEIPVSARHYPEDLLPAEGIPIIFKDINDNYYSGHFVWSSTYKFFSTGNDDIVEIPGIVSWGYHED